MQIGGVGHIWPFMTWLVNEWQQFEMWIQHLLPSHKDIASAGEFDLRQKRQSMAITQSNMILLKVLLYVWGYRSVNREFWEKSNSVHI